MALISVAEARALVLDGVKRLEAEHVALKDARTRTLAEDLTARRTQPPFRASAMDGYAVIASDTEADRATLKVIGEAPAGRAFAGEVTSGQAVRIFTGAPVPEGADAVLIQENTAVLDATTIRVAEKVAKGRNIHAAGLDFNEGDALLKAGIRLDWRSLALAASMNYPTVPVVRRPTVAILATGDELVAPGQPAGPDQIIASNAFGLAAFADEKGGAPIDLGIVPDKRDVLIQRIDDALKSEPDILITLGGASVGDHDLVRESLAAIGLDLGFWKVAMRPGKPLMFGQFGRTRVLGLPGNPVSSLVGATLFVGPLIGALLGNDISHEPNIESARLGADLGANDSRADYLRARLERGPDGLPVATAFDVQDSSMLRRFAVCDCLILRAPFAGPVAAGDTVEIIRL